jgi:ATPase subunit of ABC transporter with duplicated ATPase domains
VKPRISGRHHEEREAGKEAWKNRAMAMRIILAAMALAVCVWAQGIRLHMKDGTHHIVREYKVVEDRVRYYSTERREWEEVPIELVDLKKTEQELKETQETDRKQAAEQDAEEKFDRAAKREISRVPMGPGVYRATGEQLDTVKEAELRIENSKKHTILRLLVPVPIIPGKSFVEIVGLKAVYEVSDIRPQFYFRLSRNERFTLVKMTPRKDARLLEIWNIEPMTKLVMAERQEIEIFRQQVQDGLYKVWPVKDLEPGEYAWIEYSEDQPNTRAWDFRVKAK